MSGLVERLRYAAEVLDANKEKFAVPGHIGHLSKSIREAADHIEALEARLAERDAEVARLREVLAPFAFLDMGKDEDEGQAYTAQEVWETIYRDRVRDWFSFEDIDTARATLKDTRHD